MPSFVPLSVDTSIYCLCECLGSIYITSICLLYWLEGRKSSNFLKSWLICSCGLGFQKSSVDCTVAMIYANIFNTITHGFLLITLLFIFPYWFLPPSLLWVLLICTFSPAAIKSIGVADQDSGLGSETRGRTWDPRYQRDGNDWLAWETLPCVFARQV